MFCNLEPVLVQLIHVRIFIYSFVFSISIHYLPSMEFNPGVLWPRNTSILRGIKAGFSKINQICNFCLSLCMGFFFFFNLFFSEMSIFSVPYVSSKVGCTDELRKY